MLRSTTGKQNWGENPSRPCQKKGISVDTAVEVNETEDGIIIKPAVKKEYSLKELVKGITPQNRHTEADFGRSVGKDLI